MIPGISLNLDMGCSIRRRSWRAHNTFPATGGVWRGAGGDSFSRSYVLRTCGVNGVLSKRSHAPLQGKQCTVWRWGGIWGSSQTKGLVHKRESRGTTKRIKRYDKENQAVQKNTHCIHTPKEQDVWKPQKTSLPGPTRPPQWDSGRRMRQCSP